MVHVVNAHFRQRNSRTENSKPRIIRYSMFLRCSFRVNDSVVQCSFLSLFCSPGIDYLLNLSYYSRNLAGNTFVFCDTILPRACETERLL